MATPEVTNMLVTEDIEVAIGVENTLKNEVAEINNKTIMETEGPVQDRSTASVVVVLQEEEEIVREEDITAGDGAKLKITSLFVTLLTPAF